MFRAQLILHDKVREVFESGLRLARESGFLKGRGIRYDKAKNGKSIVDGLELGLWSWLLCW